MNTDISKNTETITDSVKQNSPGKEKRLKNLRPQWKKGDKSPNPSGKPAGQRDYATLYRLALIKIAKSKGTTPEELEADIIASGIAKTGSDYKFYKDMLDRLHGLPSQKVDVTSAGERIDGFTYVVPKE